jgi:ATP-dependent DNA helicase RecG
MRSSNDGFFIAEEDLRLRGSGEILGTKQSGLMEFRIANPYEHHELLLTASKDAQLILHEDPFLQSDRGKALHILLHLFEYDRHMHYLRAG